MSLAEIPQCGGLLAHCGRYRLGSAGGLAASTGDPSRRVGFANRRPFPRRRHLAFSRMRDREDLTHILGERLAKALGIGRHWTPLVPLNGESFSNRLAAVCYADDSQFVAICSQERRNDRHPVSGLREREQGV